MPISRKRRPKEVSAKLQEVINTIPPDVFAQYQNVGGATLESYVRGWIGFALHNDYKNEKGHRYTGVPPQIREQVKVWRDEGCEYEWDGGKWAGAQKERERYEASKTSGTARRRRRKPEEAAPAKRRKRVAVADAPKRRRRK